MMRGCGARRGDGERGLEGSSVQCCEWGECVQTLKDLQSATAHLSEHLFLYMTGVVMSSSPGTTEWNFHCQWKDCGAEVTGGLADFNRHAYFHLFHTRLKNQGQALMEQRGLRPCLMDSHSQNLIPELPENLQCGWTGCKTIYDNPVVFYNHVNGHCEEYAKGNKINATCKWKGCCQTFKSKHKLREHLRSHSQEKVCACPTCGTLFASCTKLVDHLQRQSDSDYHLYQCAHCNKKFATERLLRDHMRHHVNCYKCPFCDMTCSTPANLRLHIKYRHSSDKPYKCGHCPHSSKSASDLHKHLESHSEEATFSCHIPDCQYSSRCCTSLSQHFRKVHQMTDTSRYECHVCRRTFTRGANLTFHLKVKHKFKWPSGHSRFRYKLEEDGFFRLQTIRYESLPVEGNNDGGDEDDDDEEEEDEEDNEEELQQSDALQTATLQSPVEADGCQLLQVLYPGEDGILVPATRNLEMLGIVASSYGQCHRPTVSHTDTV